MHTTGFTLLDAYYILGNEYYFFFRRRNLKLNHYGAKHDEQVPTAKHLKLVPNHGMI